MMYCYRHPDLASAATCIACGQPICAQCREEVAGHPMCHSCVAAQQERLAASSVATVEQPSPAPTSAISANAAPPQRCGIAQYINAVLFAGLAAVIGAVIWDKFVLVTGFQFGLVAVILGVIVGVAICKGAAGRPGMLLPWIGALMAGFSILLGYALLAQDLLPRQDHEMAGKIASIPLLIRIPLLMFAAAQSLSLLDWVFVAIGVWEGWKIPSRMNAAARARVTLSTSASSAPDAGPAP